MKNKPRLCATMLAVLCCVMALSVSAFAASPDGGGYYASNENGEETPPDAIEQISISTENVPTPTGSGGEPGISWDVDAIEIDDDDFLSGFLSMFGGTALTPSGNMSLVDDILQDESYYVQDEKVVKDKQFITVESKNGNTFYIIIDRSGDTENVYFLNLVDEADLLALMEDGESEPNTPPCICKDHCEPGEVNTDCPICKNNMSECMGKQTVKTEKDKQTDTDKDTDVQSEPAEKKSSSGTLVLVLILLLAGGGALYWFKFRKKKPDTKGSSDLDNYDFGEDEDEDETEYEVETEDETSENEGE